MSFINTAGNASASTFGLAERIVGRWEKTQATIDASALRTRSAVVSLLARGTPEAFEIEETVESRLSAEKYQVRAELDRRLAERISVSLHTGWERNTFAGFRHRLTNGGGLSNQWGSGPERIRTSYSITHTIQRDVVETPDRRNSFFGMRLSGDYSRELSAGVTTQTALVLDANAQEWRDLRGDMTLSISARLGEALALKTTLRMLADNQPAKQLVPLYAGLDSEPGGQVFADRAKVDRTLTVALVVTW